MLYEDTIGNQRSTICRWVEAEYGNLTSLDLERKVGLRPHSTVAKATPHSRWRSHAAFERLPEGVWDATAEMDSVIGRRHPG